nr:PREDICTED: DNA repair protein complementing XP-A cells [Bemisia tabaci]XP_018906311.1 PREDICTED: DNA repair protein complementing XP-A cells [Bemisia tabaci]XP_018906312.1 PREDICTED: DNA repair protein complementing XP-A cells [Bemisia tabaci]XP_018906313.1 PREDICTED: DNA repair protein complementing XP-A cells [Bemisia tabaci]
MADVSSTPDSQPLSNGEASSSTASTKSSLTPYDRARIEEKRQKAILLRKSRVVSHPYLKPLVENIKTTSGSTFNDQGTKFIDTGGGFLIEEEEFCSESSGKVNLVKEPAPILESDRPSCLECEKEFADSYLLKTFDHPVCDGCRDQDEKHTLITKTDAKNEYLLKDCDLEKREPPLKFIVRKNPHNVRWGEMKLYLHLQVEKRALEVWGTEEKLAEEKELREEKRVKSKIKKYQNNMKALRMNVRSSLFNKTTAAAAHEHTFGAETYNADDDDYTRTCTSCGFSETFEKM